MIIEKTLGGFTSSIEQLLRSMEYASRGISTAKYLNDKDLKSKYVHVSLLGHLTDATCKKL